MANHPQTLYGIADSPIGLAAWFLEHDLLSYQMITRAFDGKPEGLTRDDVLDNITLTWLTNTAISGARLYRENKLPFFVPMGVKIPVAVSAFPDELYQLPRAGRSGRIPTDPLQQAPQGRPLRRLGAAEALHRRAARRLSVAA